MEEIIASLLPLVPVGLAPAVGAGIVVWIVYREFSRKLTAHDSKNDADFEKINIKIDGLHKDASEIKERIATIEGLLLRRKD